MPPIANYHLTEEQKFCLEGCRNYQQYFQMCTAFESGADERESCIFCHLDRKRNRVLWENQDVMMWQVPEDYRRPELALHMLIVPKRHVRFAADLTGSEWLFVQTAIQLTRSRFGYEGGLLHVREGDMRLNAGTVPHLHFNVFQPNGSGEVRVPVFKDPSDREKNQRRAERYAHLYEKNVGPAQFEELLARGVIDRDGEARLDPDIW